MCELGEWLGTLPPLLLWPRVLVDSHKGKAWQRWWVLFSVTTLPHFGNRNSDR